jgi:hypothetical protein
MAPGVFRRIDATVPRLYRPLSHPETAMPIRRFLAAGAVLVASGAALAADRVPMAAHRATYDLSLADSRGSKGVDSARGRIVFEFTGSACEGYALTFRQVTELSGGEMGTRLSDMRSTTFEEADGTSLRFNTESRMGPGRPVATDGSAERKPGVGIVIRLKKPATTRKDVPGEIVFPTEQIRMLIEAAKAGKPTLEVKIFDGSETGQKVYDTFAVIGKESRGGDGLEESLRQAGWVDMPRWPVSVSYFENGQRDAQQPLYTIAFDLLENGVSRNLRLDYGDFSLKGQLTRIDPLKTADCDK